MGLMWHVAEIRVVFSKHFVFNRDKLAIVNAILAYKLHIWKQTNNDKINTKCSDRSVTHCPFRK